MYAKNYEVSKKKIMNTKEEALTLLHSLANIKKIPDYKRFFKTGIGEYGEGDEFLGINVPDIRTVVKKYHTKISLKQLKSILHSKFHEERMFALLTLVAKYKMKRNPSETKDEIYNFYIDNKKQVNNWDLVDVTAPHIVGAHLLDKDRSILYELAKSESLWDKRISIISTFAFIKAHQFDDTLRIADLLLHDTHDLMHKAVGWAIRNVGNKNSETEIQFLKSRYKKMPRTMLRYAIEKLDEPLRQKYLKGVL
jgi:3-methyladenine DNA glycosylase AlkD